MEDLWSSTVVITNCLTMDRPFLLRFFFPLSPTLLLLELTMTNTAGVLLTNKKCTFTLNCHMGSPGLFGGFRVAHPSSFLWRVCFPYLVYLMPSVVCVCGFSILDCLFGFLRRLTHLSDTLDNIQVLCVMCCYRLYINNL